MPSPPTVHILLATYNGEEYLSAQLESIANQTYKNWSLLISDDGSIDSTLIVAQRFAESSAQKVSLVQGPRRGSTFNFFHLINSVEYQGTFDLFAFCDQDDIWLPEKLAIAVKYHSEHNVPRTPNLYCGRTLISNEHLVPIGSSKIPRQNLTIGNALIQNIASGNTMVFTSELLEILRLIKPEHSVWHDWSAYQVAVACGGTVFYDARPQVLYRQHNANVVGANVSELARVIRLYSMLRGSYRIRGDLTELAMQDISSKMTDETKHTFNGYLTARHAPKRSTRVKAAYRHGLKRQTKTGQLAFLIAVILRLA